MGFCNFVGAQVRFPDQIGRRLYLAISRSIDLISCLGTAGEAALKPAKLLVVLTQANPHSEFTG